MKTITKHLLLGLIFSLILTTYLTAQNAISYQAVVRDNAGELVANQNIGVQISILQGSATGSTVYTETHVITTNINGLATLKIGLGTTTDSFDNIDWASDTHFVKTDIDLTGGSNYTISQTTEMLSVPYAIVAERSKNQKFTDGTNTNDAVFNNGNVGIGTNDPTHNLEVNGTSGIAWSTTNHHIQFGTPSGETGIVLNGENSGNRSRFNFENVADVDEASRFFRFRFDDDITNLTIKKGGNIGIGTNNPAEKLDVIGKTKTTQLQITDNATEGAVLTSDANGNATWESPAEAVATHDASLCSLADSATNSIVTVGNLQFRYSSTSGSGHIEARTISGSSQQQVYGKKKSYSISLPGNTTEYNFRSDEIFYNTWQPILSLWDGSGYNDRITLNTYETQEFILFPMYNTNDGPAKTYKVFATIDGYNKIQIRATYLDD
ncbi:hypothetical protein BWZ20_14480 [Winogradskyella sp. J14-2]|uniref:hypothetical protein n=1 Tax=Winogradskyella sp. J14-2 TaxID=1936080 RepID=UPI000972CED2|nr:hypothetical protein [Winogradskyella sp. J14-2]APY09433.1 hypothetical protein BWZ20_14480 [Winogradskyella sp. J14-2]